jgi:hypothetical protein
MPSYRYCLSVACSTRDKYLEKSWTYQLLSLLTMQYFIYFDNEHEYTEMQCVCLLCVKGHCVDRCRGIAADLY